jgi:hypothetical protein
LATTAEQEDLRNLVVQLAPELIPNPNSRWVTYAVIDLCAACLGVFGVLLGLTGPQAIALALTFGSLGLFVAHLETKDLARERERALSQALDPSNGAMRSALLAGLRRVIARKRAEVLGKDSEWERAHRPLLDASHEADRSLRYWEERAKVEPESEIVRKQLDVSARLSRKFSVALRGLNRRSEALRVFIDQCEAKLLVLESKSRDYEETERLADLAARADDLVEGAEATLQMLGRQFIETAHVVGDTLASLQLVHLRDLAAEVPLDQLEAVADRIVECTDEQERSIEELTQRLSFG